ncbi:MAG: hypothetical protein WAU88_06545 [Candidatus Zixiibacteriota bacterium]
MRSSLIILVIAAIALLAPAASAQVCGDNDGNGTINISDMVRVFAYIGGQSPDPLYPALADIDGRGGMTVSDVGRYMCYLFGPFEPLPECPPLLTYTFGSSAADTFFIPSMMNIPDGIDSVSLPVKVTMGTDGYSFYLPILPTGPGDNGLFYLSSITKSTNEGFIHNAFILGDTAILISAYIRSDPSPVGRRTDFILNYRRSAPGSANIAPIPVERSTLWSPTVERNFDLFVPQITNIAYVVPPETLKTTPTSLAFSTMAGKIAPDSFLVSFTSTSLPISFNLSTSDPWIVLRNLPAGPLTTPASIWVRADATAQPVGTYNGQITMTPVIPGTATSPAFVTVNFTVATPVVYPPGDFNCDGVANLADLSIFVSYLTGGTLHLNDCNR